MVYRYLLLFIIHFLISILYLQSSIHPPPCAGGVYLIILTLLTGLNLDPSCYHCNNLFLKNPHLEIFDPVNRNTTRATNNTADTVDNETL